MRHRKHNHQLGVKSAHRVSLVANLSCSLIEHGRIKTTLAKARALRPSIEKIVTLAKKAHACDDAAKKIHYRRLAIARIRNKKAVSKLFDELVEQFLGRNGGYTRIYKLALPRLGDAADMALIEFVEEAPKKKAKKKKSAAKKESQAKEKSVEEEVTSTEEVPENSDKSQDSSVPKKNKKVEENLDEKTTEPSPKQTKKNSEKEESPSADIDSSVEGEAEKKTKE